MILQNIVYSSAVDTCIVVIDDKLNRSVIDDKLKQVCYRR